MTNKPARFTLVALVSLIGHSAANAQTVLELRYPSTSPGSTPCLYTTNSVGISADPQTGNLQALGDFGTGCPQTGTALPLPVIVPGPSDWALPQPWTVGQQISVEWAAVNAASCTYGGSSATGWPSGSTACVGSAACQTLKSVSITPPAAGTYQFSLSCSNATGTVTSTSQSRNVSGVVTQPSITGPSSWGNLQPWTAGQTKSVSWQAANADSCALTANSLPSGMTLSSFVTGTTTCSNAASCASAHGLTLNGTVAGNYSLTLTCSNSSGGSGQSTNSWTVSPVSTEGCPTVGSFNRATNADVYYANVSNSIGNVDVTTFEGIYGRAYGQPSFPITNEWPGVSNILAAADFANGQYLALKFDTNGLPDGSGSQLTLDATTWGLTGGGGSGSPIARISMTISKKCGDFDTASPDIGPNCRKSNLGGNQSFAAYVRTNEPGLCSLERNETYYLNMIYAPLTSPATAVFNGRGAYVVQIRNFAN